MRLVPHIDLSNRNSRNAYLLVIEIFWASFLAAAASFNAAYAIRLGSDSFQVGLLSSIPALLAILVSIPAGRFLQSKVRRKPWIIGSLAVHRSSFLLVAIAPWLGISGLNSGSIIVFLLIAASIPAHFFNVGFTPLLADVIPEENRVTVMSARNITYNASYSILTFLFGIWLKNIALPINYQAMYFLGFITSMIALFVLMKVEVPDSIPQTEQIRRRSFPLTELINSARESFSQYPAFFRISRNTFLHGCGLWMAGPLYSLYYVKTLQAGDDWIGLQGTVLAASTILGYTLWRKLIGKWGEPDTLKRTIICAGLYPIMAGSLPSLTVILFTVALNGIISPGINLSHFNTLLKVIPESRRPSYTALYMTFMNIGAFICPLLGVALGNLIGYGPALIICGILSVLGSTSFWISPVLRFNGRSSQ